MYFRNKRSKTGQVIQLIESFRDVEGRPRQKILLSLGTATIPEEIWKELASEVENRLYGILTLLPAPEEVQKWADRITHLLQQKGYSPHKLNKTSLQTEKKNTIEIDPATVSHHNTTELGPELVVKAVWDKLEMPSVLKKCGFSESQIYTAALSIFNRLLDPCSENALPSWLPTTSFEDLMQLPNKGFQEDRFYRIADKILEHQVSIESHLAEKEALLLNLKRTVYLYDLSNTYFEGEMLENPKAKRTKNSKEKRTDAPVLAFGMVLDLAGFPIFHKTFPGNTHDSKTIAEMIETLDSETMPFDTSTKPTVILDSGFSSAANLQLLRDRGYDYIVVGKRPTRLAYADKFKSLPFTTIEGREKKSPVQIACLDEEEERIILCLSEGRSEKENAILSNAENRYIQDLTKLKTRIEKGLLSDKGKIEKSIGRLLERHNRVSRYYKVELLLNPSRLHWERHDEAYLQRQNLSGAYYLRSSRKDLHPDEIWSTYMMLTRVEAGFKALKSHLGLRPVFHQKEDRCDSHVFITVLAYHILHYIEHSLLNKGDHRSWPTIRRLLQTHAYTTVTFPDKEGKIHHLRIPGTPDSEQQKIYQLLNIEWRHLRRSHSVFPAAS